MGIKLGEAYVVKKCIFRGVLILTKTNGKEFLNPINANVMKKYYTWNNKNYKKKSLSSKPWRMT